MAATKHPVLKTLAVNVRRRRVALGLTQEDLAEKSGFHRTYVGSVERGERNVTISTLATLAAALETTSVALLSEQGDA